MHYNYCHFSAPSLFPPFTVSSCPACITEYSKESGPGVSIDIIFPFCRVPLHDTEQLKKQPCCALDIIYIDILGHLSSKPVSHCARCTFPYQSG